MLRLVVLNFMPHYNYKNLLILKLFAVGVSKPKQRRAAVQNLEAKASTYIE